MTQKVMTNLTASATCS